MKRAFLVGLFVIAAVLSVTAVWAAGPKQKPTQHISAKSAADGVVPITDYALGTDRDGQFEYFTAVMPWSGTVQLRYFAFGNWVNVQAWPAGAMVRCTRDLPPLWERLIRNPQISQISQNEFKRTPKHDTGERRDVGSCDSQALAGTPVDVAEREALGTGRQVSGASDTSTLIGYEGINNNGVAEIRSAAVLPTRGGDSPDISWRGREAAELASDDHRSASTSKSAQQAAAAEVPTAALRGRGPFMLAAIGVPFLAQADTSNADAIATTAATVATPFIVQLAQKFPWLILALTILGAIRFFAKPIVALWHNYVLSTESKEDDAVYERVTTSQSFKWGMFVLDWLGSIKPAPKTAVVAKEDIR